MIRLHAVLATVVCSLLAPSMARACPSCSVDASSSGESSLIAVLLAVPVVVGGFGVWLIRRISEVEEDECP